MKFGAQLYSVRNNIQSRDDIMATFERLKKMGYEYIHQSGNNIFELGKALKEASDTFELPVVLTHVSFDDLKNRLEKTMDAHRVFDCKYIGLGAMPGEYYRDDRIEEFVDILNEIGESLQKNGFKFFYHNHAFEFDKMKDGTIIFDYMLDNSKFYHFTPDVYWIQYGGVNVLEYLEKLKNKCECVHLKDYICKNFEVKMTHIGGGVLNWEQIVPAAIRSVAEYLFVEQDNAVDFEDPFKEMKASIDYLRRRI